MRYLDLFSGIGGFALGAWWAGRHFEEHYFSEIDPYCVELYQRRFPEAIPLGDITRHEEPCHVVPHAARIATRRGEARRREPCLTA